MASQRIVKRFPLNLNIGNDICHVVRIQKILESSRARRFIERILNTEERGHPKISWLIPPGLRESSSAKDAGHYQAGGRHELSLSEKRVRGDSGTSVTGRSQKSQEIQVAATFLAGR